MKKRNQGKGAAPGKVAALMKYQRRKDTKTGRILLLLRQGRSLNRFEAEREGDHCLNSTIAALRATGFIIVGAWERVPNRFGSTTRVKRYRYVGRSRG